MALYYFDNGAGGSALRRINTSTNAVEVISIPSATNPHDLEARRSDVYFIANNGTADVPFRVVGAGTTAAPLPNFPAGHEYRLPHFWRGSAPPADRIFVIGTDSGGIEEVYMFNALSSAVTRVAVNPPGVGAWATDFVAVASSPYLYMNAYVDDPFYDYGLVRVSPNPTIPPNMVGSQTPYAIRPWEGSVRPVVFPNPANDRIAFWTVGTQEVATVNFITNAVETAAAQNGLCLQPDHFVGRGTAEVVYSADIGGGNREVCFWDTSANQYDRLTRINPSGNAGARVLGLVGGAQGRVYVAADDGVAGSELHYLDGANWVINLDLVPGAAGSNPDQLTAASGGWVFTATSGTGSPRLWFGDNL